MNRPDISILIESFGACPNDGTPVEMTKAVSKCARVGYIPQLPCCTEDIMRWVKTKEWNPNSTFYKSIQEVQEKSQFDIFIDALIHYSSTYGTNYNGEPYIPNRCPININYNTYKVIEAINPLDFAKDCAGLLYSGTALKEETLKAVLDWLEYCVVEYGFQIDIDSIKNRDAMIQLCSRLKVLPIKGTDILRQWYYEVMETSMIVQSRRNMLRLRNTLIDKPYIIPELSEQQKINLAKIFLRFKDVFLAFKVVPQNKHIINRLRRMADKWHTPMTAGFWEGLTTWDEDIVRFHMENEVAELDNMFKITRLIQMIYLRKMQNVHKLNRVFYIRNGRAFKKDAYPSYPIWLDDVNALLCKRLVELLSAKVKGKTIKFPEGINLACPISEKKFFGNIPYGSFTEFGTEDNVFGVYWRNKWGTRDFDLSFTAIDGGRIGWGDSYKEKDMVFSGDMTDADPEATELFYMKKGCENGTFWLNRYNGEQGSKYQLFFAKEHIDRLDKNYMVDPNNVILRVDGVSDNNSQMVGQVVDNKLYFINFSMRSGIVSTDALKEQEYYCQSYLPLKEVLLQAGAVEFEPKIIDGKHNVPDFDLSELKKDTLISLFS